MAERKPPSDILTPLELQIMQVLWANGPGTVQAVQDALTADPPLAYTTIQTMLNVLHRKKKVKRTLRGRAFEYRATVSHEVASGYALQDMLDRMFGGSVEGLLMNLYKTRQVDPDTLAALSERLAKEELRTRKQEKKND
jgi:BlaI family transcriptional regulator, penicillinase repressor